jgi:hypothetical protein
MKKTSCRKTILSPVAFFRFDLGWILLDPRLSGLTDVNFRWMSTFRGFFFRSHCYYSHWFCVNFGWACQSSFVFWTTMHAILHFVQLAVYDEKRTNKWVVVSCVHLVGKIVGAYLCLTEGREAILEAQLHKTFGSSMYARVVLWMFLENLTLGALRIYHVRPFCIQRL